MDISKLEGKILLRTNASVNGRQNGRIPYSGGPALVARGLEGNVTFVYAAKDEDYNHVVVLKE